MLGHSKSMWAIRGQLIISTFTTGCSEKPCPKKYSFFCSGIYRSLLALKQAMNQALKLMGKQVAILEGPSRWNRVPRREVFLYYFLCLVNRYSVHNNCENVCVPRGPNLKSYSTFERCHAFINFIGMGNFLHFVR